MFYDELMSCSCFNFGSYHNKQLHRALLFECLRCSHADHPDEN